MEFLIPLTKLARLDEERVYVDKSTRAFPRRRFNPLARFLSELSELNLYLERSCSRGFRPANEFRLCLAFGINN